MAGETASEVTVRKIPPRIRTLPSLPRDVGMFMGITLWGPPHESKIVVDFDDYFFKYRGFTLLGETTLQIRQAFLGGMRKAVVTRVVHANHTTGALITAAKAEHTAQTASASPSVATLLGTNIGPFALAPGDTLIGNVDAVGDQTLTFTAVAGTIECVNAENYALVDLQTLLVKIDGEAVAQTVTFNTAEFAAIGAATAEEVADVLNAELVGASAVASSGGTKVTITSDSKGTASSVEVTGGTAAAAFAFGAISSGSGNVADISSVTVAELKTLLEAAWTNGLGVVVTNVGGAVQVATVQTGVAASLVCNASSTADDELGFDNATHTGGTGAAVNTLKMVGKYEGDTIGDTITYDIAAATNGVAQDFDLLIYLGGVLEETYRNVNMDTTDTTAYVEDVVNTLGGLSTLLTAVDQSAAGTVLARRPANSTGNALTGGDDGLSALDDNDFIGAEGPHTGMHAFSLSDDGDVLMIPDRTTAAVANAATLYCEQEKNYTVTFIPDIAAGMDKDAVTTYAASLTKREVATGVAWPRVKIPNPDKAVYGTAAEVVAASSGSIMGRLAANTLAYDTDVFTQPGNEIFGRLINVLGVEDETVNDIAVRRFVTPFRVNPIRAARTTDGSFGVWLDDVQGLKGDGNFKSIGEVRGVALIIKTLKKYLDTIRTTPNTEDNRLTDQLVIEGYLGQWLTKGVFASKRASDAFYVNTDVPGSGINNPLEQDAERYTVQVGLATARARRFVKLDVTRDSRAIEAYIQQQLNAP
jgi:hypothetical protein